MLWVRCLTFLCQCFLTHKRQVTLVLTSNDVLKLSDCLEVRMQQLKASSASVSLTQGAHPFLLHLKWVHLTPAVAFPECVPPSVCLHMIRVPPASSQVPAKTEAHDGRHLICLCPESGCVAQREPRRQLPTVTTIPIFQVRAEDEGRGPAQGRRTR